MAVTAIPSFNAFSPTRTTIEKLTQTFKSSNEVTSFVIGTKVQEPGTIQITSEWPYFQAPSALSTSPNFQSFTNTMRSVATSPLTITLTDLDSFPFADGALPIVDFVETDFPAAYFTPELQERVKADFAKFGKIYRKRGKPQEMWEVGLATGWTEEQNGVRGFLLLRRWTAMEKFEEVIKTEAFQEGTTILMGWSKPFSLLSVGSNSSDNQD